jgi:hypothetical protein
VYVETDGRYPELTTNGRGGRYCEIPATINTLRWISPISLCRRELIEEQDGVCFD